MRYCKPGWLPLLLAIFSCSSYRPVEMIGRLYYEHAPAAEKKFIVAGKLTSYRRADSLVANRTIYLETADGSDPLIVMNNGAIGEFMHGNYPAAQLLFDEALADFPDSSMLANNKGCVYELSGDAADALNWYFAAAQKNPGNKYYSSNLNGLSGYKELRTRTESVSGDEKNISSEK